MASSSSSCSAPRCRRRICHAHTCCDNTTCCDDGACCISKSTRDLNTSEKHESPPFFSSSLQASLQSARRTASELTRVHLAAANYAHTAHLYQYGGDSSLTSARPHTSQVQPSGLAAGGAFGLASDANALHGVPDDLAESIQRHATATKTYMDHLGSDPSND